MIRSLQLVRGSATLSLIAERHRRAPRGAAGGMDAACGAHRLRNAAGGVRLLPAKTTRAFACGDTVEIQTAGGGGFGAPGERAAAARERDASDEIVRR